MISVTVGRTLPDRIEHVPLGATVTLGLTDPKSRSTTSTATTWDSTEVPAGKTSRITFTADQAGTFEVESHETEDVLVQLRAGAFAHQGGWDGC